MVTVQNTESHEKESQDDSSVESYVGDSMDSGPELINVDDEGSIVMGKSKGDISEYIVNEDTLDLPSHECSVPVNASTCVVIAEFALLEGVDKVADEDCIHADNSISLDAIVLFDIVGVVKSEYLVSKKIVRCMFGLLFYFCHYTSSEKLLEDWSTNRCLFWFSTFSHV
ncbi:unnamed protein product [Cuscuta campestris]|uniref:Uncharacterized protein n=1 Tax=Cuscuta campestris TaxID=132261 RepID=A0A484L6C2_9ASTE|nr:unnamed protein product [Cuscuta campestris]